jgi:MSHA type pilus biogenesis protein MshL
MDIPGERKMKKFLLIIMLVSFMSCTLTQQATKREESENFIKKQTTVETIHNTTSAQIPEPTVPEFVPVKEISSPLQTKTVSVAARNTPLRDVLYTIAETANLNLVMGKHVNPELPVTMTFKDVSIKDALNIIFDSVDYFYSIKDNILIVKAMDTEIFEFGQPNIIQEYKIDVGGDILSGTSSTGTETNSVAGNVSVTSASDESSFKLWDAIEKALEELLSQQQGPVQPSFVINRMTGTIMVTATKKDLRKVREYIANLKKVLNRQVLIEARIVEVQLSEGLKYGIDWEAVGKWLGVGTNVLGTVGFGDVISSSEPYFQFNITENDNLSLVLKALQEQGDVKTLSNPRVNIMNGQTAILSVGRNTTFISKVETTTTVSDGSPITTFTVETNSILSGVIFGLVPYINNDREITMTITPIVSNLVDLEARVIGTADNSVEIKLPTVDLREMSTTVKVLDGQMVIIGGLIDKREKVKENKVPILGDIPVLGDAFKSVDRSFENTELVIMLIPKIIG